MTHRLRDKVAVVTGGASGIGEGIVRRFVREGAQVLLADVDDVNGCRIAEETGAEYASLDGLTSERQTLQANVAQNYGRLDVMVNNAGIVSNLDITTVTIEAWRQLMSINLDGVMLGCQTAISLMRDNPDGAGGSIINTHLQLLISLPDVAYTTSKAGVVAH